MPYAKVGRVRHSESVNLIWALRGLCLYPLVVSGKSGGLSVGGRGGLRAACTLLGAGAVGAFLALRWSPNSIFASKHSSTMSASPADSSKEVTAILDKAELTVPGLQNVGNNCFLNVILQALASSKAFVSFTATCAEVTSKSQSQLLDTVSMPLAVSVSSLMNELSQLGGADRTSSPRRVMRELRSYVKHFDLASQQDAAEALVYLASAIQDERDNYIQWLKPTFQTFATASSVVDQGFSLTGKRSLKDRKGRDELLQSWRGNLHWPLEGTFATSLTCQRCAHRYTTQIQFFNDISLPLLQDREGNIVQGCTLENCLEKFTGLEWIDNVRCSKCSHEAAVCSLSAEFQDFRSETSEGHQCEVDAEELQRKLKTAEECDCNGDCECEELLRQHGGIWTDMHASASKQIKIGRSPEVLCFQLQRVVLNGDGYLKKLTGHVAFPKVLDLFPFTIAAESSMRDTTAIKTGKESLYWKNLQQGTRSSNEENSCAASEVSGLRTESSCNGGTGKESLDWKSLQQGTRSSNEENSCAASEASGLRTESSCNGGTDSCSQTSTNAEETLCSTPKEAPEISITDSIEFIASLTSVLSNSVNSTIEEDSLKLSNGRDEPLASAQPLPHMEDSLQELNSILPILPTNSGSMLTYSPLVSSISAPYVPRVFSRQLQAWSLISPRDGEQFSISSSDRFGSISAMSNAPRPVPRTSKYSRRLLFELVSVVVHRGGPQSGHYIVYRRMTQPNCNEEQELSESVSQEEDPIAITEFVGHKNGRGESGESNYHLNRVGNADKLLAMWFRVSDTQVERVSEQEVFGARAALLFYEQLPSL